MNKQEIMKYIDAQQEGKQGIYPNLLAREVAVKFCIPLESAKGCVLEHIRRVVAEVSNAH